MKREQWKDLMEGIGFLAVVASLIFLGVESRNNAIQAELNTRALQIAANQDLIDNIAEMNILTISNPEVAALMYKAYRTSEELTELEKFRMSRAFWEDNEQNFADGYREYTSSSIKEINAGR
jgi:hypothetical protein